MYSFKIYHWEIPQFSMQSFLVDICGNYRDDPNTGLVSIRARDIGPTI